MKARFLMTMAVAAMTLAACNNEETIDNSPVELHLTSGLEVMQTRAFTATQETTIASGEVVSVWVDDATTSDQLYKANQLTANGSNSFTGGNAMFFPETGNAVNIYSIHGKFATPFTSGNDFPTTAVEYQVPADQSAGGTAYTNSDLLYAYTKDVARNGRPTTVSLSFYHMLSKLELAIVTGKGSPSLASSGAVTLGDNDIVLNGNFTPSTSATMSNQSERALMLGDASAQTQGTLTLPQQTSTDFTTSNATYNEAILVPQDMSGKVLTFNLANGGKLTYTIPGSTTFESGKKYRYHITLNLTGLTVTSTIAEWDPITAVAGDAEMN